MSPNGIRVMSTMRSRIAGPRRHLARPLMATLIFLTCAGLPMVAGAQQLTALTIERGSGDDTELWRMGIQHDWREWTVSRNWMTVVAWEVQIGRWEAQTPASTHHPIGELGITPVVRLERVTEGPATLYFEGAVGAHLISRNRVHESLDMSSAYQFGDHLGVGVRLGSTPWLEISFRHQHLSNASTVQPNDGVNFNILRVVYYVQ